MTQAENEISSLLRFHFQRTEIPDPVTWVSENIRLNARQSVHKGLYSFRRTPFFRQIYLDLVNPDVRRVALRKCVQIGATQLAGNILFYYIANKTLPAAIFFPSDKLCRQFAERVVLPGIESTEALQEFLTGDIDDIRKTEWNFKSCQVKAIAGGSVSALSSNNIALAIIDECNKYIEFTKDGEAVEADAIDLIEDRTVSFKETHDDKLFITSTPTISHSCLISAEVEKGNNCFWHVPCPHCEEFQKLEFSNIVFDHCRAKDGWNLDRVRKESYYKCCECGGKITDADKPEMLNRGKWVATNPAAPEDIKSYNISGLYSLSFTFGEIARAFLNAKGSRSGLINFYNSILGEPFQPQQATISETAIDLLISKSPKYSRGELPARPKAILLSADTQKLEYYWMLTAILENGSTAIVDYGIAPTLGHLNANLDRQFPVKDSGETFGVYAGIQDAGGNQTDLIVRNYENSGGRIVPCFGRTEAHRLFEPVRRSSAKTDNGEVPMLWVNDKIFTDLLLFQALKPGGNETLYLPSDSDQILKNQLTAVSIIEKKNKKGFAVHEYHSKRDNHWFDCLKYFYGLRFFLTPELSEPVPQTVPVPIVEIPQQESPIEYYNRW